MTKSPHKFHIPVMGTGHSIDTPIRVAHFGISSVISLVDDILMEKIREYYCQKYTLEFIPISFKEHDGRAKRITAYLNMVDDIVQENMKNLKSRSIFNDSEKRKYFEMLPDDSSLKSQYNKLLSMTDAEEKTTSEKELSNQMEPGSIDVNIMVKLDAETYMYPGEVPTEHLSDAKAALRGFAKSKLNSSIVLSAGINQALFTYMTEFSDFYRDDKGEAPKRIILKVSDYRSSLTQGKFLARKGLEVSEFRIESGLNCGGHAFPAHGYLLPTLLKEFTENKEKLALTFHPQVKKYYDKQGWVFNLNALEITPLLTVQGGIGNHGEVQRLLKDFGITISGWATPFLLVPEASPIDDTTLELLVKSSEEDLYPSDFSPLKVPFNNVRETGLEIWTKSRIANGHPGSPCPKKFLAFNTEFTEKPQCIASHSYQKAKLEQIDQSNEPSEEKEKKKQLVLERSCICNHLGNGALIKLGIAQENKSPQSICPGPNLAWFNRTYTLKEMVDHIYGRGESLVPENRIHMFAQEIKMYVDHFQKMTSYCDKSPKSLKSLESFIDNMESGIELCLEIAKKTPCPGENLNSISDYATTQKKRLSEINNTFLEKVKECSDNETSVSGV